MTDSAFDTLARGADARQGRRHALKAFGAAALAAVAGMPLAAEAKKNGKNRKKRKNRGGNEQECPICPAEDCTQEAETAIAERCQAQVEPCKEAARTACAGDAECLFTFFACCGEFAECDAEGFFICLVQAN